MIKTKLFSSWRGFQLAFFDEGDRLSPVVLLIHGFTSSAKINWFSTGWIELLCYHGYRVIAIDNLGHGESDKSQNIDDYNLVFMAADAVSLLDYLGIKSALVMGYSMGARIACSMALFYPSYIQSLVLGGVGSALFDSKVIDWSPVIDAFLLPSIDDVNCVLGKTFRKFAESVPGNDLKVLASCLAMTRKLFNRDDLNRINVPVLIAVGSKDHIAGSPQDAMVFFPNSRFLNILDKDHMLSVGDKQFKQGVVDFYLNVI
ncbi:acyltransferase [Candidatus Liberibacter americanus str. Sao Paulo]|uniref:Acyltransferase n=2 Tax=Candidatus Liberibacter americanus TaxID=309868 RepID=U6B5K6_9HYPH|nr:acyltransferase [Candidatus Liberibacter americanus str. Sao Paulo]EMS36597.1 hydrolase protein [Candidatus Liberibacter americanus PW_SP]